MIMRDGSFRRSTTCIEQADDGAPGASAPGPASSALSATPAPLNPDFSKNPLPAAMLAVAHNDTPETRRVLYDSMFETWYIVPTRDPSPTDAPGFHDVREDTAGTFSLEQDSSGQWVAVAFTDEEALRNWNKTILWIALHGISFFQAVNSTEAQEIVINPFEPADPNSKMIRPGGRVTRWEFEALAEGLHPGDKEREAEAQSVLVTMPKHMPPAEVFTALADAANAFPQVIAMYFAQLIYPTGHPHKALAVEFVPDTADEQIDTAMDALEREAKRLFPRKETTDLFLVSSATGQSVANSGKKFYSLQK
jgi:hypothetical protein